MWNPNPGRNIKKLIKHQKEGVRGSLYDQASYPKLNTGGVQMIFASLYPLEKGFIKNNGILLQVLDILKVAFIPFLLFFKGALKGSARDFFLRNFTKLSQQRIDALKKEKYWIGFLAELEYFKNENDHPKSVGEDSKKEIDGLITHAGLPQTKTNGTYVVADKNHDPATIPADKVITILSIEGMGILSQELNHTSSSNDISLRNLTKQEILNRIQFIKNRVPLFFITFCHHFDNGLCGHARSMPVISQSLGLLDQGDRLSEGFTPIGFEILMYLLSVKKQNGQFVDDPDAGRRILIDLKHMSIAGRLAVYDLVENYNGQQNDPKKKIPLIASHVGYSGLSEEDLVDRIAKNKENDKEQIAIRAANHGREFRNNSWSINLGSQEINRIIDSGGLIGLSMEQNILGVGFFEKIKKKKSEFHTLLLVNQLLSMAQASGTNDFWKHIAIGTDFDGIVNPVDRYSSTLYFSRMRSEIINELNNLNPIERQGYHISGSIESVVDDFCFNNAFEFVKTYFKSSEMPPI